MNKNFILWDFKVSNKKKYKVEKIWKSAIYVKESKIDHSLSFYYLVF